MIVDTHCHLDFKDFDLDRESVLDRARQAGVVRIINVGSSLDGTRRAIELSKKYDIVYASVGIHPHDAASVTDDVITEIRNLAISSSPENSFSSSSRDDLSIEKSKVVAIGEVGLDYYRNLSPKEKQIEVFRKFISLAQESDLPLIIHSREADEAVINILKDYHSQLPTPNSQLKGVIHCFSGSESFLKECLDIGFHISFTCNLTFKNAKKLRELAKTVPTERILLETDAPFLSPEGMRGKRNEPSYLTYLVEAWSRITNLTKNDIERITTHNANKLFKLGIDEKMSKVAYQIRDSLYLNITNECTNNCYFCVRAQTAFVKGHNLKLDKEPTIDEILKAIGPDPEKYREIVFCGYGEPMTRLDVVKEVARWVKGHGARVRLVTNGHGDLINKRSIAKELVGLIDKVSVSLNTDNEKLYNKICKPEFGTSTHSAVLKFTRDCVENHIETEITCLNLPEIDMGSCKAVAAALGASFRQRMYGVTG
jgi:TatD DNase family protein